MIDEARNSGCAREMSELGEFVVPTFNYQLRADKPPIHYYFMMVSYTLFGVNEFAARFFSAVFGALTLLLTFLSARRFLGLKQALYAILVLFASLNLALEFHLAVPDPSFIFFMTAANLSLFNFLVSRKPGPLILMYVFTGLAVMAKGPVAIVLIGLTGLVYLIIKKEFTWSTIKQFNLIAGVLIVLAIFAPWFFRVGYMTDWQWTREFFFDHNVSRFVGAMEGHGGYFILTILYVFLAFLPFAAFIIQSYIDAFKKLKENDLLLFSTVTSLVIILFFSISSTKLPNYPMPAYPFIAIIIGSYLTLERTVHFHRSLLINLFISLAIPVALYFGIRITPGISSLINLTPLFLIIPLGAIVSLWLWYRSGNFKGAVISIAVGWIVFSMIFFLWILPAASRNAPVQPAISLMDTSKSLAYYRRFNQAFPFYVKKPILQLKSGEDIEGFFREHPDGYLISAAEYTEELKHLPLREIFRRKDLFETPVTVVYKWDLVKTDFSNQR